MPKKVVSAAQKHALMTKMLGTAKGRTHIAASIQEPLRTLRDYSSVGRRLLMVDELPDGTLSIYDKDIDTPAYVVGEEADSIQEVVKGERVHVPTFELASYPKIPFTQVKERRFDVISRIKKKAKDELFRKEDALIFAALDAATDSNADNPKVQTGGALAMTHLADAYAKIETHGHQVSKVVMNAAEFKVLRNAGRDYVDFETQRELLNTGFVGKLWGADIFMSPEVTAGNVYLTAEPEYVGVMPVRIDLTVVPADDPGNRSFGWSIFEAIGISFFNSKSVCKVEVTA